MGRSYALLFRVLEGKKVNKKNGLTVHDIGKTRRLLLSFPFRMLRLIELFCFNLFSLISLFQKELICPCSPWWDIAHIEPSGVFLEENC